MNRNILASVIIGLILAGMGTYAGAATLDGLDLNLVGTANLPSSGTDAGELQLTPAGAGSPVGAAWIASPLSTTQSFSTTFTFDFSNPSGIGMADGFAFAMQNAGTSALGGAGGAIGLAGINGAIGAELQTFRNTYGVVPQSSLTFSAATAPKVAICCANLAVASSFHYPPPRG
jgi:hypothetical protein